MSRLSLHACQKICISWNQIETYNRRLQMQLTFTVGFFFFSTSVFKSCATTSAWDKRKPHLMSKCCLLSSHLPDDTQLSHVHALMNTHIHTSQSQITNKVSSISKCLSSFGTELKSINSWSVVKNKNSPNAVCVKGSKSTSMNLTTFFSVPGTKQVQVLQWVS